MKRSLLLVIIFFTAGLITAQNQDTPGRNKAHRTNTKSHRTVTQQPKKKSQNITRSSHTAPGVLKDTVTADTIKNENQGQDKSKNETILRIKGTPDSLTAGVLRADTLLADTLAADTIAADTIAADTLASDTLASDTLRPEPIYPLTVRGLKLNGEYDQLISRREILYNEYRYAGDYFRLFPLAFNRNLGLFGQPHELTVYGAGFNEITYMQDGLPLNNPLSNSLDLNTIQTEFIDSIEVIPSVRGFLYGNFNNSAAVNFISRDHFEAGGSKAPYTRVRYYQGPNEEAFVDFIYRAYLLRRLIAIADITNSTIDPEYFSERAYGSWKGTARLKYLVSNSLNVTGSYRYIQQQTGLFGGIDINRLAGIASQTGIKLSEYLYDELAPSLYTSRYRKLTDHYFNLKAIGKPLGFLYTDLNIYYNTHLSEFRQNEHFDTSLVEPPVFHNNRHKLWGASLRQSINAGIYNAEVIAGYESVRFNTPLLIGRPALNSYSVSGRMTFSLVDSSISPSVFAKYLNYDKKSYAGMGADITLRYNDLITLYGGASYFARPLNPLEMQYPYPYLDSLAALQAGIALHDQRDTDTRISSMEAGARLRTDLIYADLSIFSRRADNLLSPVLSRPAGRVLDFTSEDINTSGIGLKLNAAWKSFRLETASALYYSDRNSSRSYRLPEYSLRGAIYFQDTLFESNLFLRTGFQGFNTGVQDFYRYDFETGLRAERFASPGLYLPSVSESRIPGHWQLDFVLIGEIRRRAIIYFVFENLLGNQYFTVPYFTNLGSGLRIGASWEFLN